MSDSQMHVVVACSRGELPRIGEFVHVMCDGNGCYLQGSGRQVPVVPRMGQSEDEVVDLSHIRGAVNRIEDMRPIPGSYPPDLTEIEALEIMGERYAIWITPQST